MGWDPWFGVAGEFSRYAAQFLVGAQSEDNLLVFKVNR